MNLNGYIPVGANRWVKNATLVLSATPSGPVAFGDITIDPNEYFGIPKHTQSVRTIDDDEDDDDDRRRRKPRKRCATIVGAAPVGTREIIRTPRGYSVFQVDPNTWQSKLVADCNSLEAAINV